MSIIEADDTLHEEILSVSGLSGQYQADPATLRIMWQ